MSRIEEFTYDEFNQLTNYYEYYNGIVSNTSYTYDARGNITSIIKKDAYNNVIKSITLTYKTTGWFDQLKTVTIDGITYNVSNYNSSGNPLNYLDYTVTYFNNNISSLVKGSNTYNYSYNADGIRISKNVNGVETQFSLDGNKIIKESRSGVTLKYTYDINGELVGFAYDGNVYVYLKNIQNDIIGIANANGDILVKYFYGAYGNIIKVIDNSGISLANINPFRFKSYYYDNETGLFLLTTRYYNPEWGRFLNADDISYLDPESIGGLNLYPYCGNNPIMRIDPFGTSWLDDSWQWIKDKGKKIGNWFRNNVGASINVGKEVELSFDYYWLFQTKTGVGYSKSFDNGKPINFFVNVPGKWWKLSEYSVGIDVNVKGWGLGFNIVGENSINFHLGKNPLDIYANVFGRIGGKWSTLREDGSYSYFKFEINGPEIVATVALIYFAWPYIVGILKGTGGLVPIPG